MPRIIDEDGPIEKIPLWRFPVSRGNRHLFETLAAQVGRDLERHADVIGSRHSEMAPILSGDINGDFNRTIPGAVGEIQGQLGSFSEIDPAHMYVAALESVNDLTGTEGGLPPEGAGAPGLPGVDGSQHGEVQWAESGASAPPSAPRPPSGPGAPPPPGGGTPGEPGEPPIGGEPPPPPPGEPGPGEPPPPPPDLPPAPPGEQPGPEPPPGEDEPLF